MNDMPEYLKRKNDNYLNSLELKETIKNFLVDYQDADLDNWATTDLLLITAVSLLEQVVENE